MITISYKINGFCSMCAEEKEDTMAISLYVRNNRDSYNRIFLCEKHMKQLANAIIDLFEDGEKE